MLRLFLFAVALPVAQADTITEVVSLLQEMLDKSKEDGKEDRTVYAKYLCYCDTTTATKEKSIADETENIERFTAELEDMRATNTRLSQEVATLEKNMADNQAARDEATSIRDKENEDFVKEEADLETGIDQLGRAVDLLSAVGADQTVTGDTDSAQLMAGEATAAAKAAGLGFMTKESKVKKVGKLSTDMKEALRAASVFLDGPQRHKLTSFLQASSTGINDNYNAQSGEIVGVLKNMHDTFKANLESARTAEAKAKKEFDELIEVKTEEYNTMETAKDEKKKLIGDTAAEIATSTTSLETSEAQLADDQEFVATLKEKCATSKAEYERRNMLRANEEAAIAEAISILNSDEAFASFGKVGSTSAGRAVFFFQKSNNVDDARMKAAASLSKTARSTHSLRLAKIATVLQNGVEAKAGAKAENPFTKVLEMIEKTIGLIDAEEEDDVTKKDTCQTEQDTNNENKNTKESEMSTLETNINSLEISAEESRTSIATATDDLAVNRASQASETKSRAEGHAVFAQNLKNCEDAEKILAKATEVLEKYYTMLNSENAVKTYAKKEGKDSGGGNMERLAGKSVEELEEACSADPTCVGFNSAGWLKSSLAPEEEWYAWDGGDLYVKELSLLQMNAKDTQEPDDAPELNSGQGESGNQAITMLKFIHGETVKEKEAAIETEQEAQGDFESSMQALTASEEELKKNIEDYKLALATTEKQLEEAKEDLATTTKEHAAIVKYLAEIEPGCTFIQTKYDERKANREAEKAALENAIELLKNTPVFQAAEAAQEKEDLGKCAGVCEEKGMDHAECGACQEGVTVFGYCASSANSGAPGCSEATATGSADALA
jgi:chromosome segregation ATPase